ncbi:MAG TPA: nuclease A inhibitor family protein [Pyrinomonadaceae bacterium]
MAEKSGSGNDASSVDESASAVKGSARRGASKAARSLREELEEAAAGLSYMSESDYPYKFFSLPSEGEDDLTPEGFLNRLGLSPQLLAELGIEADRLIEERALEDFFPDDDDLAERRGTDTSDPKVTAERKKLRKLLAALKRLRGVRVFRVGQVEIRCYIAGLDEQGNIAGLVTTAIET